jgi:OOP family OmpA-OmpF porin
MRTRFLTIAALSTGLMMSSSAVFAAAPQPQYSVQDIAKTFGQAPASDSKGDQAPAASAPPAGFCESKGKVTGPGGLCYPANASTAGFNLGRKSTASTSGATAPRATAKAGPQHGGAMQTARAGGQKDLLITFKVGSADLTDQGRVNAGVFAKALKVVPQLADARFKLSGYTDASGDRDKNVALSQRRAEAVKAFLISSGVDGARLTAQGYGPQNLLPGVPASSPQNRRVVATKE